MKKMNAFIFICFYLFATKIVFASTVDIEGKSYECKKIGYQKHSCMIGAKKAVVVFNQNSNEFVAIVKESNDAFVFKGIKKIVEGKKVEYQSSGKFDSYEDSTNNRMLAASVVINALEYVDDKIAQEFTEDAKRIKSSNNEVKSKVKITLNSTGETYSCTRGTTRPFTLEEMKMQAQYKVKFMCTFFSCVGKNSKEKMLLDLPKAGNTFSTPTAMSLMHGSARYIKDDFKITDDTSIPFISIPKKTTKVEADSSLLVEDLDPDLLVPSSISKDVEGYNYLLGLANKKNQEAIASIDMCSTDKKLAPLFTEQQNVANKIQELLAKAEIVEYLKVIDNKIISYYIDKSKSSGLGCNYQNKIVDRSVMDRFENLKKISTIKSTGKFLKPNEVQELFKKAKNMKDIPFGYKYDGCYARAHIMARRFEEMGISTQKVWIKGKLSVPNTDIAWEYHVAPSVQVQEKDGKIVNYVIDPSLTDKAVPLDEWVASMSTEAKGPVMKTTFPFPVNGLDFERTTVAVSNTDVYGPTDLSEMTEDEKMQISKERLKTFSEALSRAQ